jgi:CRP/FNR family transcriptional regulator
MQLIETSLFKNVSTEILNLILKNSQVNQCLSKHIIIREENLTAPNLYIIKSGVVVISKSDINGTDVSISIKKEGDPFGTFSVVDDMPTNAKAVALCATEYWSLSGSFIKEILLKDNNFTLNLLKFYTNYIRNLNDFQTSSSFGGAQKKLLYQLMKIGEKKVGKDFIVINNYISQSVISSFAGVTRETTSREIQKLKKSHILKVNSKRQLELDIKLATILLDTG